MSAADKKFVVSLNLDIKLISGEDFMSSELKYVGLDYAQTYMIETMLVDMVNKLTEVGAAALTDEQKIKFEALRKNK